MHVYYLIFQLMKQKDCSLLLGDHRNCLRFRDVRDLRQKEKLSQLENTVTPGPENHIL